MHVNSAQAATGGRLFDLTSNIAAAYSGHCNCLSCKANFLQHKVLQLSILPGHMLNSPLIFYTAGRLSIAGCLSPIHRGNWKHKLALESAFRQ